MKMRIIAILSILCFWMLQLSGCGIPATASDLTAGRTARPVEEKPLDETFYTGQMDFSLKLFQQVAEESAENVLISPLSVALALAMTANGADGTTAEEMQAVLGGYSMEELNAYLHTWMKNLPSESQAKLELANSIWYRDAAELNVKEAFLQTNVDHYDASIYQDAFDQETVKKINQWVKTNTDGMIPHILNEIDPDTMMILINALAFDAKWNKPYEKSDVNEEIFTALDGTEQTAQMMRSIEFIYLEEENAVGFLRNYKGGNYSFGALLPNEGITLSEFIDSLTVEGWKSLLQNAQEEVISAYLPKFSNEYSMELNDALKAMGMPSAFNGANFSKISDCALFIDRVIHKTFIEVDEQGTKAAAVTGIMLNKGASGMPEKEVRLDRPFVYFILDNNTNLPIFMGTVTSI